MNGVEEGRQRGEALAEAVKLAEYVHFAELKRTVAHIFQCILQYRAMMQQAVANISIRCFHKLEILS